jgi:hypothetical protein
VVSGAVAYTQLTRVNKIFDRRDARFTFPKIAAWNPIKYLQESRLYNGNAPKK